MEQIMNKIMNMLSIKPRESNRQLVTRLQLRHRYRCSLQMLSEIFAALLRFLTEMEDKGKREEGLTQARKAHHFKT